MREIRGYEAWMRVLMDQDMPTLNAVVREICEHSGSDTCHADELTAIILRDATLTSKVLKIANSIHYNHSFTPIKTVSRGIVQLGFDNVRNIALTTSLVDGFLTGHFKMLLIECLAKSFHAAVQARALVPLLNHDQKEQVFIAALLRNVGELALLASGREVAELFVVRRNQNPADELHLAQSLLGVDIQQLNNGVIKAWALQDLVLYAGDQKPHSNAISSAITLGVELSRYIHKGLQSPEMLKLYPQVAAMNRISLSAAAAHVRKMAEEAALIAQCYGVNTTLVKMQAESHVSSSAPPPDDHAFQKQLNQLLRLMFEGVGLAKIFQVSLECLAQGSGIARLGIATVNYTSKTLAFQYVAGKDTLIWRQHVHIGLDKLGKQELLYAFLQAQKPLWYQPAKGKQELGALQALCRNGDILLAPIKIDNRLFAVIYADAAEQQLSARQFEDFQLIGNQLNLILKTTGNNAHQNLAPS